MATYEFQEKEIQTGKTRMVFGCEMTDYDTPITPRENLLLALKGQPVWMITVSPKVIENGAFPLAGLPHWYYFGTIS